MLYVLIAVIALVAIYFLFLRKAEPAEAPKRSEPPKPGPAIENKKPSPAPAATPSPAHAEQKDQTSAPRTSVAPPPPSRAFDGFVVRDDFMNLRTDEESLSFLNQYGRFSQLPNVDSKEGWTIKALMKWQKVFADLAKLKPDRWSQYGNSLMSTEQKGTQILAVVGALNSTRNSLSFRVNNLGIETVKHSKFVALIDTEDVVSTIFTTLQIDHVRGTRFGVCARHDCPRFYEITSRHRRKYCSYDCAHLETVRRLRKRQKAKSNTKLGPPRS